MIFILNIRYNIVKYRKTKKLRYLNDCIFDFVNRTKLANQTANTNMFYFKNYTS